MIFPSNEEEPQKSPMNVPLVFEVKVFGGSASERGLRPDR